MLLKKQQHMHHREDCAFEAVKKEPMFWANLQIKANKSKPYHKRKTNLDKAGTGCC